jgi:hypothetical protein
MSNVPTIHVPLLRGASFQIIDLSPFSPSVSRRSFLGNRSTSIEVFPGKRLGVHCYGEGMNAEPLIAEIAGLIGEPARATMLSTLLAMAELSPIPRTAAS